MLAFLAARGVPVVVLAAAAAADALAAAAGGTFAPALAARFGGGQLTRHLGSPAAWMEHVVTFIGTLASCPGSEPVKCTNCGCPFIIANQRPSIV